MARYCRSTSFPRGVTSAPPPPLPPRTASTRGPVKALFIASTRSQARRYDIPMVRAARLIEPVAAIASRSAALPGPMAVASPSNTRRRGCGDILLFRGLALAQALQPRFQIGNQICRILQPDVQAQERTLRLPWHA